MKSKKIIAIACIGLVNEVLYKKKHKRRIWSKAWLQKRKMYNDINLLRELRTSKSIDFENYLRMGPNTFNELLNLVTPYIQTQNTIMRECFSSEKRLVATLRYLAAERSYECLKFSTGISAQSLGRVIPETCKAICQVLRKDYLKVKQREILQSFIVQKIYKN